MVPPMSIAKYSPCSWLLLPFSFHFFFSFWDGRGKKKEVREKKKEEKEKKKKDENIFFLFFLPGGKDVDHRREHHQRGRLAGEAGASLMERERMRERERERE